MKRKLSVILLILICFCSVTVFASCDAVLDLIFGPKTPANPSDGNEPAAHVHQMTPQTFTGETCVGQGEITYYKCESCKKFFLDEQGVKEIADVSLLGKGHLYVLKATDGEHYSQCEFCQKEQEDSRAPHSSDRYWYNPDEHYKLCDVCGKKFDVGSHDETGSCSVCGRQADYKEICNSRYGYDQLASFEHGADMQKLYNRIDDKVKAAHDDERLDATRSNIGETADGQTVYAYALSKINSNDCHVTAAEAYVTVSSYNHDNPLYYWIAKQCSVSVSSLTDKVDSVTICVVDDYANGQDRTAQNQVLYNEIDKYLSAVSGETDPYYMTLGLHDAIIDSIDYAVTDDGTAENAIWAHSIVGVLDKKSAVCEGYAKAFQLLLNACGVDNVYVTGSSRGVGHAWNTIKLDDGKWYWFDLTWDDQPTAVNGRTYNYFCKTDSVFSLDHTVRASNPQDGVNYLYPLPTISQTDYESDLWLIGQSLTLENVTYTLVGYDRLAVTKVLTAGDNGTVTLLSSVERLGRAYTVRQINDEALVNYYRNENGIVTSIAGPSIKKLIIPSSVDTIYNKSIQGCSTLVSVQFQSTDNWQRFGLNGQAPVYEKVSSDSLSNETTACRLLKELYKPNYYCVWIRTAD